MPSPVRREKSYIVLEHIWINVTLNEVKSNSYVLTYHYIDNTFVGKLGCLGRSVPPATPPPTPPSR